MLFNWNLFPAYSRIQYGVPRIRYGLVERFEQKKGEETGTYPHPLDAASFTPQGRPAECQGRDVRELESVGSENELIFPCGRRQSSTHLLQETLLWFDDFLYLSN